MSLANMTNLLDFQTILIFFTAFLICVVFMPKKLPGKLPPGPPRWPLVGNLPLMLANPRNYEHFFNLSKIYGDIFTLNVGKFNMVILNSLESIREALVAKGDYFLSRPPFGFSMKFSGGKGVLWQRNLDHWKDLRRFTMTALRDFGVGKTSLEERVQEEIDAVFAEFNRLDGAAFDIRMQMVKSVSNIIVSVVFGKRFEYDDPIFIQMQKDFTTFFTGEWVRSPENFLPWLEKIPFRKSDTREFMEMTGRLRAFVRGKIDAHRETFDKDNIRDFVDLYLSVLENDNNDGGAFSEENMFQIILDLFLAGTDTTSTSLQWAFLFMVLHPQVMKKCRQEIHQVVGESRLPRMSDRSKLPYTEAVLLEVQRCGNTIPFAVPHEVNEKVTLRDYILPVGTVVLVNLYAVHMNDEVYPEPESFKPERWLDQSGKIVNKEHFIPFSIGKRVCAGEGLAKMELFLFFTSLIQHYDFTLIDPSRPPSLHGKSGITKNPERFDLVAVKL